MNVKKNVEMKYSGFLKFLTGFTVYADRVTSREIK